MKLTRERIDAMRSRARRIDSENVSRGELANSVLDLSDDLIEAGMVVSTLDARLRRVDPEWGMQNQRIHEETLEAISIHDELARRRVDL